MIFSQLNLIEQAAQLLVNSEIVNLLLSRYIKDSRKRIIAADRDSV